MAMMKGRSTDALRNGSHPQVSEGDDMLISTRNVLMTDFH